MKPGITSGILIGVLLSAAGTALAAGTADSQTLITLEQRWVHAAATGDEAALAKILAPDFVDVSWRGTVRNRDDMLARPAAPASSSQTLKNLQVRRYGDTAIVNGLNLGGIKGHHWKIRFTDVFVKQDGHWRAVSAQETLVRTATDPHE